MLLTQFLRLLMTYLQSRDIVHIFYVVTYTYFSLLIVQVYSTKTGQNVQYSSVKNAKSTGISSRDCEMTYCSSLKFSHLLKLLDVRGKFLKSVQSSPEIRYCHGGQSVITYMSSRAASFPDGCLVSQVNFQFSCKVQLLNPVGME